MDYDDDMEDVPNHLIFRCRLESTENDLNDATHSIDELHWWTVSSFYQE